MTGHCSILVAEDDENDVFFLKRAFKDAGIENPLHVTTDGQETIEWLSTAQNSADRALHPLPCLLILDLKMPRKTGMDVLRWLRQEPTLHCLPTIIFSSSAHRHDVERAYRLGVNAFVVKPSGNEERKEFAQSLKLFWLNFNKPPLMCTDSLDAARKLHAAEALPAPFF